MNILCCHAGDNAFRDEQGKLCDNAKWCLCYNMQKYNDVVRDWDLNRKPDKDGVLADDNPYGGGYILMGPGKREQCFPNCDQFIPIYKPYPNMLKIMKKWRKRK